MALVAPGQRYLLTRGKAQPVALPRQRVEMPEQGGALEGAPENRSRWIRMPFAIPMPPLVAARADGQKVVLPAVNGSPFLINLWDPECEDCAVELQDWKAGRSRFPKNLQLAALLANPEVTLEGGKKFVEALGLPFPWGKLGEDSAFLLAKFLQEIFQTQDSFPAPASFLVNGKGELVSFAIGKLTVDDIVSEVAAIPQNAETTLGRLQRIYGQKGLWLEPVERQNLLFVPQILVENGQVSLAASYVRRAWSHLSRHRQIDRLLVMIGQSYFKAGNIAQAVNFYLNALNQGSQDPVVMNNVAWELATNQEPKIRNGDLALKWASKAVEVTKGRQAGFFDTLAAAYAEKGRFQDALEAISRGLEIANATQNLKSKASLLSSQKLYSQRLHHYGQ
jgi:tetratricopeptide (TPR) repeat protein